MKAIVIGSGPSKDYDLVKSFDGLRIACDKEYHGLVKANILVDYVVTLEDEELSHYFLPPHQDDKPLVVISGRTTEKTRQTIGDQGFLIKVFDNAIQYVISNVGMNGWFFAWYNLKCDEITLTGFDHLYPHEGYNILHHLWRDQFHEFYNDYCPKYVKTIVPKDKEKDFKTAIMRDSISLDRVDSKYPGFGTGDIKDYIRYRRDRNVDFVRKFKAWGSDIV